MSEDFFIKSEKETSPTKEKKLSLKNFFLSLIATPVNAVPFVPLIEYNPSQSHTQLEEALHYISEQQNNDGSFTSSSNKLFQTYETAQTVAELSLYNNTQIDAAILYIQNVTPSNSLEQAMKSRATYALGRDHQQAWHTLIQKQNPDGGFGLIPGYHSDIFTTLEVVRTLSVLFHEYNTAPDVADPLGFLLSKIEPNGAIYLTKNANPNYYAINKMIRILRPFESIEYQDEQGNRHRVREKIDAMLNFLASEYNPEQKQFRWSTNAIDFAMTAANFSLFNVHSHLKESLLTELKQKQSPNGSFENNYLATTEALLALGAPDLEVTQVTPSANTQNSEPLTLTVTLHNKGQRPTTDIDIHLFFDNLFVGTYENLQDQNLRLLPGETAQVRLTHNDTSNLLGDTKITLYIETTNEAEQKNNWYELQTNFAPRANGQPALPLYYIAQNQPGYRFPGINIRWPNRPDPRRHGFLVMYKIFGTAEWSYAPLGSNMNGGLFTGSDFEERQTYEVTVGVLGPGDVVTYFSDVALMRVTKDPNSSRSIFRGVVTDGSTPVTSSTLFSHDLALQTTNDRGEFLFTNAHNGDLGVSLTTIRERESFVTLFHLDPSATQENIRVFTKMKTDAIPPVVEAIGPSVHNVPRSGRLIDFEASGTDTIGITKAHFSYYHPQEQTWNYLGMASSYPGQNTAVFSWYIPENLLGPGFKIKATLVDYQGNTSEERESLPFEIISGTPPQFTLTAPNGNETWQLGSTSTIRWTLNQNNSVPLVSIDALYGEQSETIASNIPNTGSFAWRIPPSSLWAGNNIRLKVRGEDNRTQLIGADVSDAAFRIVNSSTMPQAPWSEAQSLTAHLFQNVPNTEISQAKAAYTADGTTHVVYRVVTDVLGSPRLITEQLLYTKRTATSTWSQPLTIYNQQTQTDLSLAGYSWIEEFVLEALPQNKLALLFNTAFPDGCVGQNQKEIFFMQTNERGEWNGPQNISSNQNNSQSPRLGVEPNGKVHIAWTDGLTFDAQCTPQGTKNIFYKTSVNGQWTQTEILQQVRAPAFTDLAVTTSGTPFLVYRDIDDGATKYTRKQNNVWSASTVVSQNSYEGDLVSGQNNRLQYVVKQNARILWFLFDGNNWSQPQEVFVPSASTTLESPSLTFDSLNRPHIIAQATDPQTQQRKVLWTMKQNNTFLPSQVVHQEQEAIVPEQSRILANSLGQVSLLYKSAFALREHIFWSTADVRFFPPAPAQPPQALPQAPTSTPVTSTPVSNLIFDGDMEIATTSLWRGYNVRSYQKTSLAAASGRQSMYAWSPSSLGGVQQDNMKVVTGTQYTLSMRYKINSGIFLPRLTMNNGSVDFENRNDRLTTTGTWQTYTRTFTVPNTYIRNFRPRFLIQNGGGYFDDVSISPANLPVQAPNPAPQNPPVQNAPTSTPSPTSTPNPAPPAPPQPQVPTSTPSPTSTLIQDPSFESPDISPWTVSGQVLHAEKIASTTHGGRQSMWMATTQVQHANAHVVQNNIPVIANQRYRLRIWYRVDRGFFIPTLRLGESPNDFQRGFLLPIMGLTSGQWRMYERIFTAPANPNDFRINLRFYIGEGYVDDITLEAL